MNKQIGDIVNGAWRVVSVSGNKFTVELIGDKSAGRWEGTQAEDGTIEWGAVSDADPLQDNDDFTPDHWQIALEDGKRHGRGVVVDLEESERRFSANAWQVPAEAPIVPAQKNPQLKRGDVVLWNGRDMRVSSATEHQCTLVSNTLNWSSAKTAVSVGVDEVEALQNLRNNSSIDDDDTRALKRAVRLIRNDMQKQAYRELTDAGYATLASMLAKRYERGQTMDVADIETEIARLELSE